MGLACWKANVWANDGLYLFKNPLLIPFGEIPLSQLLKKTDIKKDKK